MLPPPTELERRARELFQLWRVVDTAVQVEWNPRLSTTAGRAFVRQGRVELNPHLLQRAPEQLTTVLTHEVAHLAAARLFGANVAAHGRHWRSLMALAGQPPAITHDIPVRGLRRARYLYLRVCDACGDRRVQPVVRYGRCHGCGARDRYLVMRARSGAGGRRALQRLSLAEVRARCAQASLHEV